MQTINPIFAEERSLNNVVNHFYNSFLNFLSIKVPMEGAKLIKIQRTSSLKLVNSCLRPRWEISKVLSQRIMVSSSEVNLKKVFFDLSEHQDSTAGIIVDDYPINFFARNEKFSRETLMGEIKKVITWRYESDQIFESLAHSNLCSSRTISILM